MLRAKRSAFTLVELVVVILILCVMLALLIPNIESGTTHARSTQCINNQRQWSLAIGGYTEARKHYPGYRNSLKTEFSDLNPYPASWVVELLPYAESNQVFDLWRSNPPGSPSFDNKQNPLEVFIPFAVCPSNPRVNSPGQQPLSYVVNAGLPDAIPTAANAQFPADWPANGVFVNRYAEDEKAIPDKTVPRKTIPEPPDTSVARPMAMVTNDTIRNGTSNTLLLSESLEARYYYDHGFLPTPGAAVFPRQVGFNAKPFTTPELTTTMVWHANFDPADQKTIDPAWRINSRPPVAGPAADMNYARPSSNHPGVVVVTFCDGRTQTLSETIDYRVYCQLMTSNGRKANPPGMAFTPTADLPAELQPNFEFQRTAILEDADVY